MAEQDNKTLARWRADFFTGLAIVLPGVISVAVVVWLFRNVANVTDTLLFFLPPSWTHIRRANGELGDIRWWWSWIALLWSLFLICLVGRYGRNYLGRQAINWADHALMRIPLLNKIYGTIKQVNASFSSNKTSFKQVAMITFPHARSRSIGFVTGEQKSLSHEKLIMVFVPTTPNPTSGFLMLLPESEVTILDMTVADGIKFVISLGAIAPEEAGHTIAALPVAPPPPPDSP